MTKKQKRELRKATALLDKALAIANAVLEELNAEDRDSDDAHYCRQGVVGIENAVRALDPDD